VFLTDRLETLKAGILLLTPAPLGGSVGYLLTDAGRALLSFLLRYRP
jgi:hypothetical protein